jgi:GT2 family glycosyltransferase
MNLGFAGGNNAGIKTAIERQADYIFLLNNDTVVDPKILDELRMQSEKLFDHCILGAKIYFFSDPEKIWYEGAIWNPGWMGFVHVNYGKEDLDSDPGPLRTDYICGCALFASTKVFSRVGLLDERFFLTYEETDFCYRARQLGFDSFVASRAKLWHKVSASFGGSQSSMLMYFMARNILLWAEKHLPLKERIRLTKKMMVVSLGMRGTPNGNPHETVESLKRNRLQKFCQLALNARMHFNHPVIRSERRGIFDYFFRRFGDCPRSIRKPIAREQSANNSGERRSG